MACVAVQQQLRLYREGLGRLLDAEEDIEVVGLAQTADELVRLCRVQEPQCVVVDATQSEASVTRLTAELRRTYPDLNIVGLYGSHPRPADVARAARGGMSASVARSDGVSEIVRVIRHGRRPLKTVRRRPAATARSKGGPDAELTDRELVVLQLVGAGCTSKEISERLAISHKTVENHKQRIFRKLGVQNQAHAVSVAMKAGQLRPERVMGLAANN